MDRNGEKHKVQERNDRYKETYTRVLRYHGKNIDHG